MLFPVITDGFIPSHRVEVSIKMGYIRQLFAVVPNLQKDIRDKFFRNLWGRNINTYKPH